MQKYTKQNCILEFGISVFYNVEDSYTQSFHSFKKNRFLHKDPSPAYNNCNNI